MPLARSIRMAEPVAVRPPDPTALQVQAEAGAAEKQHVAAASAIDTTTRLILCSPVVSNVLIGGRARVNVPTSLLRRKAVRLMWSLQFLLDSIDGAGEPVASGNVTAST